MLREHFGDGIVDRQVEIVARKSGVARKKLPDDHQSENLAVQFVGIAAQNAEFAFDVAFQLSLQVGEINIEGNLRFVEFAAQVHGQVYIGVASGVLCHLRIVGARKVVVDEIIDRRAQSLVLGYQVQLRAEGVARPLNGAARADFEGFVHKIEQREQVIALLYHVSTEHLEGFVAASEEDLHVARSYPANDVARLFVENDAGLGVGRKGDVHIDVHPEQFRRHVFFRCFGFPVAEPDELYVARRFVVAYRNADVGTRSRYGVDFNVGLPKGIGKFHPPRADARSVVHGIVVRPRFHKQKTLTADVQCQSQIFQVLVGQSAFHPGNIAHPVEDLHPGGVEEFAVDLHLAVGHAIGGSEVIDLRFDVVAVSGSAALNLTGQAVQSHIAVDSSGGSGYATGHPIFDNVGGKGLQIELKIQVIGLFVGCQALAPFFGGSTRQIEVALGAQLPTVGTILGDGEVSIEPRLQVGGFGAQYESPPVVAVHIQGVDDDRRTQPGLFENVERAYVYVHPTGRMQKGINPDVVDRFEFDVAQIQIESPFADAFQHDAAVAAAHHKVFGVEFSLPDPEVIIAFNGPFVAQQTQPALVESDVKIAVYRVAPSVEFEVIANGVEIAVGNAKFDGIAVEDAEHRDFVEALFAVRPHFGHRRVEVAQFGIALQNDHDVL